MVDEVASLVQVVLLDDLLDVVHIAHGLEIAVGAVVPAGAAHGQEVPDIIRIMAEFHPGGHAAQRETARSSGEVEAA